MQDLTRLRRVFLSVVVALSVAVGTSTAAAGASTLATESKAGTSAAALLQEPDCGGPGDRVLTAATGSAIYLIDPEGYWRLIPSPTTYFALFGSWAGLRTVPNFCIAHGRGALDFAYLVMDDNGKTYISDNDLGFRWITSLATFERYHFDWAKVGPTGHLPASVIGPNWS